jgi:hypothetical protein
MYFLANVIDKVIYKVIEAKVEKNISLSQKYIVETDVLVGSNQMTLQCIVKINLKMTLLCVKTQLHNYTMPFFI